MRLDLGSPVRCSDDAFGELADVVIDPKTRCVTHLVVQPHQRDEQARLVPVDRAQAGQTSNATISLGCTVAQMSEFERVREAAYLRLGEVPVEDPDWDVGIEEPLALPPSAETGAFGAGGVDIDPHVMLTYDRIPVGEVELEVIHLRGHTPGSIALLYRDPAGHPHLFTGDSLFPGGPGKTASPENFTSLMNDLESRVFDTLPDDTWFYPGHGDDATLGSERPKLAEWRQRGW